MCKKHIDNLGTSPTEMGWTPERTVGNFPGKNNSKLFFFLWGHSWRDFPGQIYIHHRKIHHGKVSPCQDGMRAHGELEPLEPLIPSQNWIHGHWVYLNHELNMVWWCPSRWFQGGPSCGPAHMTTHNPVFHRFCVDEYLCYLHRRLKFEIFMAGEAR